MIWRVAARLSGTSATAAIERAGAGPTFGPPAASYRYKEYEILAWRRGVNLLAHLRRGQSETPAAPKDR